MAAAQVLTVFTLCVILGFALYFLWFNFPHETRLYDPFIANATQRLPATSLQFYPNLRYPDRNISYGIEAACDEKKKKEVQQAFAIIENLTILNFFQAVERPQIRVYCSALAPEPKAEGHFVAGEGGPVEIINSSRYAVILAGKISFYRSEKCARPNVALHEIFHALGFDHVNDRKNIMYPVTECSQEIGEDLIGQINEIYSVDSLPDIAIEKVIANTTGRYLNFEIVIVNNGLRDSANVTLNIVVENRLLKEFELDEIAIGQRKTLYVKNLRTPGEIESVTFTAVNNDGMAELDYENNHVTLELRAG